MDCFWPVRRNNVLLRNFDVRERMGRLWVYSVFNTCTKVWCLRTSHHGTKNIKPSSPHSILFNIKCFPFDITRARTNLRWLIRFLYLFEWQIHFYLYLLREFFDLRCGKILNFSKTCFFYRSEQGSYFHSEIHHLIATRTLHFLQEDYCSVH